MNSPLMEIIKKRRSVRRFLTKPVSRELIEECLEAARLAPSACNAQPWQFIVIDDEAKKNAIAQAAFKGIFASNKFAAEAPVLIAVINDQRSYLVKAGDFVRNIKYSLIDIGIACEHFVLRAAELSRPGGMLVRLVQCQGGAQNLAFAAAH